MAKEIAGPRAKNTGRQDHDPLSNFKDFTMKPSQRRTDLGRRRTLIDETEADACTDISGSTEGEAPRL
jgi:hypothetical protein